MNLEVAADLTRHQKAVNVVRWSPNGEMLASGDDESIIFVWKQKMDKEVQQTNLEGEEQYKESWVIYKVSFTSDCLFYSPCGLPDIILYTKLTPHPSAAAAKMLMGGVLISLI